MEYDLLIDLGTGSTRAALVDRSGKILAMRSFLNRYYRDEAYPDAQFSCPRSGSPRFSVSVWIFMPSTRTSRSAASPPPEQDRALSSWTPRESPSTVCRTSTTAAGNSWVTSVRRI